MSLQIHEFSRELIDISEKNGRWVSGGFGSEVGSFNHPVPEKIKDAVNCGDFRINDNYPPEKKQEYALIAREIDKFSVLAVATGEVDDKNRQFVAYRYFWLEKAENNIDSVGVLLKWWLEAGKPKFDFLQTQTSTEINYSVRELSSHVNSENCEQLNPQFLEKLADMDYYAFPRAKEVTEFSFSELHLSAIHLQKQSNTPLAWAWNVRHLEHPDRFKLIYYTDETYPHIVHNIHQLKKSIETMPNDESSVKLVSKKIEPDEKTYGKIKQCLLHIVNADFEQRNDYLKLLIPYIEQYPINQWNWKNLIDKEMIEESWSPNKARYIALLVIFGQKPIDEWLYWLKKQRNDCYKFFSFALQKQLFQKLPENHEIIELIEAGIINLLLQYTSGSLKPEQEETHISNEIRHNVQRHRFSIFHFLQSHLEIIILVGLMILGLSAITYIVVQEKFPQLLEQNSK